MNDKRFNRDRKKLLALVSTPEGYRKFRFRLGVEILKSYAIGALLGFGIASIVWWLICQ